MPRFRPLIAAIVLLVPALAVAQSQSATRAPIPTESYSRLHWRTIGPEGNRFSAAVGIPGDPLTYYVGAASGGTTSTTVPSTTTTSRP